MSLYNSRRSKALGAIIAIAAGASGAYAAPPIVDDSQEQDKVMVDELADEWSSAGIDKSAEEEDQILPADENDSGALVVDDTDSGPQIDNKGEQGEEDSIFLKTSEDEQDKTTEDKSQDTNDDAREENSDFLLEEPVDDPEQVLDTEQESGTGKDDSFDVNPDFTTEQETEADEDEPLEVTQEEQEEADSTGIVSGEEPLDEFEQNADAEVEDGTATLQNDTVEDTAEESELVEEQPWDKPKEEEEALLEEEEEDEEEQQQEEADAGETAAASEYEEQPNIDDQQLGIATVLPETIIDDVEKAQKELGISGEVQQDKHHADEEPLLDNNADIQVEDGEWGSPGTDTALSEDGGLDSVLSEDATEEPTIQYTPTEEAPIEEDQEEGKQGKDEPIFEQEVALDGSELVEMETPSANGSKEVEAELEAINDTLDKALDAIEKEKPQLDTGLYAESAQEFGNAGLPSGFVPADKYKEDGADMTLNVVIVVAVLVLFIFRLPKIKVSSVVFEARCNGTHLRVSFLCYLQRWLKSRSSNDELPVSRVHDFHDASCLISILTFLVPRHVQTR